MARIPTSGATVVTPYRTEAELVEVLAELCPQAEFTDLELSDLYLDIGAIIGRWSAEQTRHNTLSIARRLTAISKNVAGATGILSAHQTGIRNSRDIAVVSQLKIVLAADPQVGSFEKADALISSQEDPTKLANACLIAAENLKKLAGKSGRPKFDWYDDFTMMLLQIAHRAGLEPQSWKDRIEGNRGGWLFEAAWRLESFLHPDMVKGGAEACGSRLDRSKRRLKQGLPQRGLA